MERANLTDASIRLEVLEHHLCDNEALRIRDDVGVIHGCGARLGAGSDRGGLHGDLERGGDGGARAFEQWEACRKFLAPKLLDTTPIQIPFLRQFYTSFRSFVAGTQQQVVSRCACVMHTVMR